MDEILKIDSLSAFYGKIQVINQVSMEFYDHEIVSIIGANGAGKSTLFKTISGLITKAFGSIIYRNQSILGNEPYMIAKAGLIHVPEGRQIFTTLTVRENLELGAYQHGKVDKDQLDKIFDMFPRLKERNKQQAGTLSGGEQQMLAIGRALLSKPSLLILDEPSLGLAPLLVNEIYRVIAEIGKEIPVILVEQNAKKALEVSDRVYVMGGGKIHLEGRSKDLLHDNKIIEAYLGKTREKRAM